MRRERRAQIREELVKDFENVVSVSHPILDEMASEKALIEAMDEDIAERGLTDRNGKVRSIVELRIRAGGRLQRLLAACAATPASRARVDRASGEGELANQLACVKPGEVDLWGNVAKEEAALNVIAFSSDVRIEPAHRLSALEALERRRWRDLKARGF
jgi:hypothetical protein